MKTTITKFLTVLFVTTLFSSCAVDMFNRVNGNKNVVTEDRSTKESFTEIKVSNGLELHLYQGSKNKIIVDADENLQDIIITEVNNGVLEIYSEKSIWRAKSKKIFVTIKNLESVTATSGADVYAKETIKVDDIRVSSTSGADINISVDAITVETSSTSGSDIEISGVSNKHISSATSGASIDAYDLHSKIVIVKVTSGADINVYASESLDAKATSGGDIDFKGNPKNVNKKSSSGGDISAK